MLKASLSRRLGRLLLGASVATLALSQDARADVSIEQMRTASPIKHVIIIVGENRSFDHLFATYRPKSDDEHVLNLLSERIVKDDGSPSENFDRGHQFQITSAPNGGKYFISAGAANKTLYTTLPPPDVNGVQNPPAAAILELPGDCRPPTNSSSALAERDCRIRSARTPASPTSIPGRRGRSR